MISYAEIYRHLERYRGKRVAILYSAGFDSSVLAHALLNTHGAEAVALMLFDCGKENSYNDDVFARRDKPQDLVQDIWQFRRYAEILDMAIRDTNRRYEVWPVRTPHLNALTARPEVLLPPDNPSAERDERDHGLLFYSGFVMLRLTTALSIAAAQGYDYVLTGHMGWNEHYLDEGEAFAERVRRTFAFGYEGRLAKIPRIEMPYRDLGLNKVDLIHYNERSPNRLNPRWTFSCNVGELQYNPLDPRVAIDFKYRHGLQIHCGKCQHCLDRKASFEAAGVADTAEWAQ